MTSQTTRNDCANARRTSSFRGSSLFGEASASPLKHIMSEAMSTHRSGIIGIEA